MNNPELSFETVLEALLDEKQDLSRRHLSEFSDIQPESLKSLLGAWQRVSLKRKLHLLDKLNALADADTLVSFDDLGRALLTDAEAAVRIRAMRLLVECEDERLVPSYIDILKQDADSTARAEAASLLGLFVQLGELEDISERTHHEVEDVLMEVASGDDIAIVRRRALEGLGFSSRLEVPTLIQSAYDRQDPDWKASALFAMGRSNDERWQNHVLQMLAAEDEHVRLAAVQAAGELSLDMARPLLLRLLTEEDDEIIIGAAIWSLSQIGGEDVRTYLESLLANLDEDDEQIAFLEEALDNLAFTEDLTRFDLLTYDAGDEIELEE